MSRIVALDTETTGLDPDTEDVFEIATVELDTGRETVMQIEPRPEVVAAMHPRAAEANRYHERTAQSWWSWLSPGVVLDETWAILDGAHIVGAVPDFDARHLTSLYRRFGSAPPRWHYHLIDIEAMAVGYLHGHPESLIDNDADPEVHIDLPWRSDDLSRACGVEPPSDDERHTALGDARWAARWYRTLTGEAAR